MSDLSEDLRDTITEISDGTSLNSTQMMAAILEASGVKPMDIYTRLGMSPQWLYNLRYSNEEYRLVVKQLRAEITTSIVEQVVDVNDLFNGQIKKSVATVISIRDDLMAKDSDRLKASFGLLDRAPAAPKVTQIAENRNVVISLPVKTMAEMQKALEEDGGSESLEVVEMMRQIGGGQVEPAEPDPTEQIQPDLFKLSENSE